MIAKFFIDRPIFANVIAILIVILGSWRWLGCRWRSIPTSCRRPCR